MYQSFQLSRESEARKPNFRAHLQFILDNSGLGDQSWRFLQGDNHLFEQNLQDISKEASPPKGFSLACTILKQMLALESPTPSLNAQAKAMTQTLSKGDPLLKIKSIILSLPTLQDKIVHSLFHVVGQHSSRQPGSIDAFRDSLRFYAVATNTTKSLYVIPQECTNDTFEFMSSFMPGLTLELVKAEIGKICLRKRKNKPEQPLPENYLSSYKGKDLHFVSSLAFSLSLSSLNTLPVFCQERRQHNQEGLFYALDRIKPSTSKEKKIRGKATDGHSRLDK